MIHQVPGLIKPSISRRLIVSKTVLLMSKWGQVLPFAF